MVSRFDVLVRVGVVGVCCGLGLMLPGCGGEAEGELPPIEWVHEGELSSRVPGPVRVYLLPERGDVDTWGGAEPPAVDMDVGCGLASVAESVVVLSLNRENPEPFLNRECEDEYEGFVLEAEVVGVLAGASVPSRFELLVPDKSGVEAVSNTDLKHVVVKLFSYDNGWVAVAAESAALRFGGQADPGVESYFDMGFEELSVLVSGRLANYREECVEERGYRVWNGFLDACPGCFQCGG